MNKCLFLFLGAFAVSLILTPLVRSVAQVCGAMDVPGGRKIHTRPIPRLGGISIFIAFYLVLFSSSLFSVSVFPSGFLTEAHLGWLFLASTVVLVIGVIDDFHPLTPNIKFLFQILAGVIIATTCFRMEVFPFGSLQLGIFSIPVTVFWVVAITNAINLLDGLDGLAGGTSLIVCISLLGIALLGRNTDIALVLTILAGAILGFLKYNLHPASIFLGDSGAYFLGFLLSVLSLMSGHKETTTTAVLAPMLALGLPIMDTALSMLRRLLKSLHIMEVDHDKNIVKIIFADRRSIFTADRAHIHHKLLQMGLTQRKAVALLYAISASLGIIALSSVYFRDINQALFVTLLGITTYVAVKKLGYSEIRILSNGSLLPLVYTRTLNKKILRIFVDAVLIAISYYLAIYLRFEGSLTAGATNYYLSTLPLILVLKISIFYIFSLYREVWLYTSIGELMKLVRAVTLGCAASAFLFWALPNVGIISHTALIIDFNLLLVFMIGTRLSFRILDHLHVSSNHKGRKVLIYGAGKRGVYALKEIISNPRLELDPIGFIDDSIRFEGKQINGFPVFGTLDALEDIIKESGVSEVILCREDLARRQRDRLKEICNKREVSLSHYRTTFESVGSVILQHPRKHGEIVLVE